MVAESIEQGHAVGIDCDLSTVESEVDCHRGEVRFAIVISRPTISRRSFLAGAAAAALLAACGGDDGGGSDDTGAGGSGDTTEAPRVPTVLGAGFADGYASAMPALVAGIPQRAPFVAMTDIREVVRDGAPESIDVEVLHGGASIASLTVDRHGDGIPTPYYPVVFTPPEPGDYEVRASFASEPTPFKVADRSELSLLQVGEPMRPVITPTTADARGVDPICTRPDECPFHSVSLSDALAAGGPVALMISTPGFCQTAICGPVLELLIEAAPQLPSLTVVHAEVYVAPEKGDMTTTEVIPTYGLPYEPSLFVADATGTVTARLDFSWDRTELEAALATIA